MKNNKSKNTPAKIEFGKYEYDYGEDYLKWKLWKEEQFGVLNDSFGFQ